MTGLNRMELFCSCGLVVLLAGWLVGCDPTGERADLGVTVKASAAETKAETKPPKKPEEKVASATSKIVFVGKENACECTRKAIEMGWSALQKALEQPARLPVERLQIDTEPNKVAVFEKQKAIFALPAIYFVDGKNTVLELLQGEVTETQIRALLPR